MMATIITLDPPPMLKLARNVFGELGIFLDSKCRKIEWKFITKLHEKQVQSGLKFGNTILSNTYSIFPQQNESNVCCYSYSWLECVHYAFRSSFFPKCRSERTVDRLSDILNVKNLYGKSFKQPLKSWNKIIWGKLNVNLLSIY